MLSVFRPSQSRSLESAAARLVVDAVDASSGRRTAAGGARSRAVTTVGAPRLWPSSAVSRIDGWCGATGGASRRSRSSSAGPRSRRSGANASASQRAPVGCAPTQPRRRYRRGPMFISRGSLGSPCSHRSGSASCGSTSESGRPAAARPVAPRPHSRSKDADALWMTPVPSTRMSSSALIWRRESQSEVLCREDIFSRWREGLDRV